MQDTRFTSMLHECFGGRKAIRTFLLTGKLEDIRVPPVGRTDPTEGRRPEALPRVRPNQGRRRQKYFSNLLRSMAEAQGRDPPPHRTTQSWYPFVDQVHFEQPIASTQFLKAGA